jgi:hypothetical protein
MKMILAMAVALGGMSVATAAWARTILLPAQSSTALHCLPRC